MFGSAQEIKEVRSYKLTLKPVNRYSYNKVGSVLLSRNLETEFP